MAVLPLALLLLLLLLPLHRVEADGPGSLEEVLRRSLPAYGLAEALSNSAGSSSCHEDLRLFQRAIEQRTLWALKMLDASGEPKPGFVYGNNYWLGSQSQCQDVNNRRPLVLSSDFARNNSRHRPLGSEFPPFPSHYFVAHFRHNSTIQYHVRLPNEDLVTLGLCLPASCSNGHVARALDLMFSQRSLIFGQLYAADFKLVQVRDLRDDNKWTFSPKFVVFNAVILLILLLMLMGSVYEVAFMWRKSLDDAANDDPEFCENNNEMMKLNSKALTARVKKKRKQGPIGKFLLCFSVASNSKLIFSTKLSSDSVSQIHGIRFIGMLWIVMIHTVYYMSDYADNKPWSWRLAEGFAMQIISNSTLSVDTFFFLSGFLVAYMYLNAHKNTRDKQINFAQGLLEFSVTLMRRFIRLTPAYMMMIGIIQLNTTWYEETSQFYLSERPHETCEKYWWRNLLYINNLFGREAMCMSWSWYLSNDMQFFVIAELLLILSSIYFYLAAAILSLLLFSSIFITGYIAYINNYVPTIDEQFNNLDLLYDPPWTRIGPYLIGMITGFIIIRFQNNLTLSKSTVVTGWTLGVSCNLIVLFGLYEKQLSVWMSSIYVALSRTMWAIGLAWLLIACYTNHGGVVNKFLCFKVWIPLSRLTYCAYLLNPFLINLIYLRSESAVHVDFLPNVTTSFGNLFVTYFCSYILSLMLETPTIILMRTYINVKQR